jgi:hypothetical protein
MKQPKHPNLNYSPKLKAVMEEIKPILAKHDLAGCVFLYDNDKGEYFHRLDTKKGVIRMQKTPEGELLRFRSKLADFNGDKEAQKQATEHSVGTLRVLCDMMGNSFMMLEGVYQQISQHIDIEHTEGVHTPHEESELQ